jgi:hypothetical protein
MEAVYDLLREEIAREPACLSEVYKNLVRDGSPQAVQLLREGLTVPNVRHAQRTVLSLGQNPPLELEADLEQLKGRSTGFLRTMVEHKLELIRKHKSSSA